MVLSPNAEIVEVTVATGIVEALEATVKPDARRACIVERMAHLGALPAALVLAAVVARADHPERALGVGVAGLGAAEQQARLEQRLELELLLAVRGMMALVFRLYVMPTPAR